MPRHVAANAPAVPAVVSTLHAFGLGQSSQRPVVEQQLVGLKRRQITLAMQLLPVVERTARQQAHPRGIQFLNAVVNTAGKRWQLQRTGLSQRRREGTAERQQDQFDWV